MSRRAGASRVTSRSPIVIRPELISSRPPIDRRRVVFPHPDGPTRTMNSPSAIVIETSSTATTPPANSFVTLSRTIWPTRAECNARRWGSAIVVIDSPPVAPYSPRIDEVAPGVVRLADTCNVYVLRSGRDAVLVDFGSGAVLDRLEELGVDRVTDVLVTHHHREQVQGLARAPGARVWVPPHELELFAGVERWWASRPVENDYDLREDRFSLLEDVEVSGTVDEYRTRRYGE